MKTVGLIAAATIIACVSALPAICYAQQASVGCRSVPQMAPEISGTYVDDFGGLQAISASFWVSGPLVFEICSVDNAMHRLVALNNARNSYNPAKFSAFDWTVQGNKLWYCQVAFDAATENAAAATPPADPQQPGMKGCGQYAWSTLIKLPR